MATTDKMPDRIPARMLNEFTYCPRLAYLEWVQGEWADNADTVRGSRSHRRTDIDPSRGRKPIVKARAEGVPESETVSDDDRLTIHSRSLRLSSEKLGLVAVLDLVESTKGTVRPVDYKKGKRPHVAHGAHEPERVQLCAQGLLLREQGFRCHEGILYFAGSKERVRIRFTKELEQITRTQLAEMRRTLGGGSMPPPLQDSPKCPRCSLLSICLPDETNFLRSQRESVRTITVSDAKAYPLVVQKPGAKVRLKGRTLRVVKDGKELAHACLGETSELVLMSGARCTMPTLRECARRNIPVAHMSGTGRLYAVTRGMSHKNVELRIAQYRAAFDGGTALRLARGFVENKIENARVLLRRNGEPEPGALGMLRSYARRVSEAASLEQLLGLEGNAARIYFANFSSMLRQDVGLFEGRSRRPPTDPVNALLSFSYALLTKEWVFTLERVGLDPYLGYLHQPRYSRPALALDLMEPFRPIIADSVVLQVINNREVVADDFREVVDSVLLKPHGRKALLSAWGRRMRTRIQHPVFGYRCSYRRVLEVQARLLARHLLGELETVPAFQVR